MIHSSYEVRVLCRQEPNKVSYVLLDPCGTQLMWVFGAIGWSYSHKDSILSIIALNLPASDLICFLSLTSWTIASPLSLTVS